MAKVHDSLTELVGHTPLVRLHGYEKKLGLKAHILASTGVDLDARFESLVKAFPEKSDISFIS